MSIAVAIVGLGKIARLDPGDVHRHRTLYRFGTDLTDAWATP